MQETNLSHEVSKDSFSAEKGMPRYFFNGKLMFTNGAETFEIKKPAIMYDKTENLLLKHGEFDKVMEYYNIYTASMNKIDAGIVEDTCVVSLEKVSKAKAASFLNQVIEITGCVDIQLQMLHQEIQEMEAKFDAWRAENEERYDR